MATAAPVLSDNSLLSRFDKKLFQIETVLALISGLTVLGLMFLAVASASGRNFFNHPLPGYVDWIEFAMPFIAILGIAYCQRLGIHIRMDLLIGRLHGRILWMLEWISTLFVLIFMILLTWGSWSHFLRSFDISAPLFSRDSSLDIGLPLWPAKLVVPIAFAIITIRLILQIWGYTRAVIYNFERPVAVPLKIDAVEQASQEAQSITDESDNNVKDI